MTNPYIDTYIYLRPAVAGDMEGFEVCVRDTKGKSEEVRTFYKNYAAAMDAAKTLAKWMDIGVDVSAVEESANAAEAATRDAVAHLTEELAAELSEDDLTGDLALIRGALIVMEADTPYHTLARVALEAVERVTAAAKGQ